MNRLFLKVLMLSILMLTPFISSAACTVFTPTQLAKKKAFWVKYLNQKPASLAVNWITGQSNPPGKAKREAKAQLECLLKALRKAKPGRDYRLISYYRSAKRQGSIWHRKFNFNGSAFDTISDQARAECASLLKPSDQRWMPSMKRHRKCWHKLTANRRQQEILQASSAPGISRHHWGTDFDIVTLNSEQWRTRYRAEYQWLKKNAAKYGFIQVYTDDRTGEGYFEERWHWSYYPVAQALLSYAKANQKTVEKALVKQWQGAEKYGYIEKHWRAYMFNVNEKAWF